MTTHKVNTQRRFGEAGCYIYARIDGKPALFTEDQIRIALDRARKQPEDLPRRWWQLWPRSRTVRERVKGKGR